MPCINEMVLLRRPHPLIPRNLAWKITSRYTLWLGENRSIECVRVSSFGPKIYGLVLHLSVKEFNRMFKKEDRHVST